MILKNLSNTDDFISAVGQGTMGLGGYFCPDDKDDDACIKALQFGLDCGLSFIDTAEAYGKGHTEELVGRAFKHKRKDVFLASKVSPENLFCEDVIAAAEDSLKRLKTDVIDLYQIHWPNPCIPIEESVAGLCRLVEQGKIRHIGVSNFSVMELKEIQALCPIVSVQSEYNLFDKTVEDELLPFCQNNNITFIAYSPLDKAKDNWKLQKIADKYNISPAQVSLNWLLRKPNVVAIPKAKNLEHIKSNSEVIALDKADISLLENHKTQLLYLRPSEVFCNSNFLEGFTPGYQDLGQSFIDGVPMKPIRVEQSSEPLASFNFDYILTEGKVRYWAWHHAYGDEPCPALYRGEICQ